MSALKGQVDGSHYTDQKLQPIELSYLLGATPAFCKLAKYLTRVKNDKLINCDKAVHCVNLELELKNNLPLKYPLYWITGKWYKYVVKDIHPLIKKYTDDYDIRMSLRYMHEGDYVMAEVWANVYKNHHKSV